MDNPIGGPDDPYAAAFADLRAVCREHMTDEEIEAAKLETDRLIFGTSFQTTDGRRVDPTHVWVNDD